MQTFISPPINNLQHATAYFLQEVTKGKGVCTGYAAQWASKVTYEGKRYIILLKRDYFRTFYRQFPELPAEYRTIGQTVTLSTLTIAAKEGATIVTVMSDGAIYACNAKTWYDFATLYQTIRRASTSPTSRDLEASIPVRLLQRLNPA